MTTEERLEHLMPYIQRIARHYARLLRHGETDDLVQAAALALLQYAKPRDTEKRLRCLVHYSMKHYLYKDDLLSRPPGETRQETGGAVASLDTSLSEDDGITLLDTLAAPAPPHLESDQELVQALHEAVQSLTDNRRRAILQHFGFTDLPSSFEDIARQENITPAAARSRVSLALDKLHCNSALRRLVGFAP
jgi:RNA polymerase sigma factor (sigma-70 family)